VTTRTTEGDRPHAEDEDPQRRGRHLLEHKSSKKTRSIANDVELNKPQAKKIKKLLGK